MAEASAVAFGRFLRQLRERRGLSLARVCEISRSSPEAFDKGTLSRLERGQQSPSIFRLGPLSRIYDVSADALLERMELDREVDRIGVPDTGGLSYDDLHRAGGVSVVQRNRRWDAYAYFRDALLVAPSDKLIPARINLASAISALGKNALALHELRDLEAFEALGAGQRALVRERMSTCCRCLGDMKRAEDYADSAAAQAKKIEDWRTLAFALSTRADAAIDQEQWTIAYDHLMEALAAYRDGGEQQSQLLHSPSFEALTLLKLAECSLQMRNAPRARRLITAAERISKEHDLPLGLAYSELLLGWIDEGAGRPEKAIMRWRRAIAIAARTDYPRIAFTAEVEIFRLAQDAGNAAAARASRRRLERLAPWVPKYIPAFRRFIQLIDDDRLPSATVEKGDAHEVHSKVLAVGARDASDLPAGRRPSDRRPAHAAATHRSAPHVR